MADVAAAAGALKNLAVKEPRSPQNGQEEGHDSGVDESTQSQENGEVGTSSKGQRATSRKRQPRSVDPSPFKRTPQSAESVERKKVPMNKVEVGKTASPNLKVVKSKIGSLENSTYRPGGGKVKIETKKMDFSKTSSRIAAKNDAYIPGGGTKKIESQKLKWNAQSKIGSLENKDHKPGGGEKQIETQKIDFKNTAQSKVGSRDNIKHKAGGGDIQINEQKVDFTAKAKSKVGSLNNVTHKPGGGEKKIFDDKDYLRQMSGEGVPTYKTSSSKGSSECGYSGTQSPDLTSPVSSQQSGVLSPQQK